MNEKNVWIEIYFCGYMCMKLWGLELGNSMHLQDAGFTFNLVRKFAFWLWTCFSDTFMPSLNQKSKGRYTYFSSDDNNYFDIRFIHHTFKKTIISCDLWHMLYFQNLNIYVTFSNFQIMRNPSINTPGWPIDPSLDCAQCWPSLCIIALFRKNVRFKMNPLLC